MKFKPHENHSSVSASFCASSLLIFGAASAISLAWEINDFRSVSQVSIDQISINLPVPTMTTSSPNSAYSRNCDGMTIRPLRSSFPVKAPENVRRASFRALADVLGFRAMSLAARSHSLGV